jgi:hypothetical protein
MAADPKSPRVVEDRAASEDAGPLSFFDRPLRLADISQFDQEYAASLGIRAGQEAFLNALGTGRPVSFMVGDKVASVVKAK